MDKKLVLSSLKRFAMLSKGVKLIEETKIRFS